MKIIIKLIQIIFLYGFYLIGDLIGDLLRDLLHLPLPGSIIGLLLLWGALNTKFFSIQWIESGASSLLSVLPLFFIPATIAIMNYGHFFSGKGSLLILITITSTFLTMGVTSTISRTVAKRIERREAGSECN